jgi:Protein kinase domain
MVDDRDDTVRQRPMPTLRGHGDNEDVGSAVTQAPRLPPAPTPGWNATTEFARSSESELSLDGSRYAIGQQIGEGGMGEVLLAIDERIGREVAVKRTRTPNPSGEEMSRFVREARVQGRLEHPAVVPVHDLAVDATGRPFFVMKRIASEQSPAIRHRCGGSCCARSSRCVSPSSSRTRAASSTAISSRRTSCSATSARCT